MIKIEYKDAELQALAERIRRLGADLKPAMQEIGEYLVRSTKRRFAEGQAPDGTPWAPNTEVTLARFAALRAGGSVRKKGEAVKPKASSGKKPLVGESKRLSSEIVYRASATGVEVGSSLEYAATQQFGARAGSFGHRIPWGDIPARPFLGLSDQDKGAVLEILGEHLENALKR